MVHGIKMASLSHDGFILQITVQELKEKIVEKMVSCSRKNKRKKNKKQMNGKKMCMAKQTSLIGISSKLIRSGGSFR